MLRFEPTPNRAKLLGQLLWFLFWLAVTAIGLYLTPNPNGHGTHHQLGLPPCAMPMLYHRLCPGCGLTTSFTNLVHGDIGSAFRANLLGPILYSAFTVTALICAYAYFRKLRWNTDAKWFTWSLVGLVGAYLIFGIWRMATVTVSPSDAAALSKGRSR